MRYMALAAHYKGILALAGEMADRTVLAVERLVASSRELIFVPSRPLSDSHETFSPPSTKDAQVFWVTLLRVVACLFVFGGHFLDPILRANPTHPLIVLSWTGSAGIVVFAFVSGFGLAYQYQPGQPLFPWFKRRLLRVFPTLWVFYLILAFFVVGGWYGVPSKGDLLLNVLGLNGVLIFSGRLLAASHTWFITFILMMYLMFPMIFEVMSSPRSSNKQKHVLLGLVCLVSLALSVFVGTGDFAFFPCVTAFWYGVFWSLHGGNIHLSRRLTAGLSFALFAACAFRIYLAANPSSWQSFPFVIGASMVTELYPFLIVPLAARWISTPSSWYVAVVSVLSTYSFEIYLYHRITMREYVPAFLQPATAPFLALAFSVALTAALSWVAYRLANPVRDGLSKAIVRLTGM